MLFWWIAYGILKTCIRWAWRGPVWTKSSLRIRPINSREIRSRSCSTDYLPLNFFHNNWINWHWNRLLLSIFIFKIALLCTIPSLLECNFHLFRTLVVMNRQVNKGLDNPVLWILQKLRNEFSPSDWSSFEFQSSISPTTFLIIVASNHDKNWS